MEESGGYLEEEFLEEFEPQWMSRKGPQFGNLLISSRFRPNSRAGLPSKTRHKTRSRRG